MFLPRRFILCGRSCNDKILFIYFRIHHSLLWDHWFPSIGLLVMSFLDFKARIEPSFAYFVASLKWILYLVGLQWQDWTNYAPRWCQEFNSSVHAYQQISVNQWQYQHENVTAYSLCQYFPNLKWKGIYCPRKTAHLKRWIILFRSRAGAVYKCLKLFFPVAILLVQKYKVLKK